MHNSETEVLLKRWAAWLKLPGNADRVAALALARDDKELERLVREVIVVGHASWDKAIARANAKFA